ncbi:hypothetical protein [Methylobacterium sp. A52T]
MATKMMTKGMTVTDHIVAWSMVTGLALAVLQFALTAALPTHFV